MKPEIVKVQQMLEEKFNAQIEGVDAQAAAMDDEDARRFLTNYSCAQADNTMIEWQNIGIYLMVKYLDGQERKEENGQFKRNAYGEPTGPNRPAFPESYLRTFKNEIAHE